MAVLETRELVKHYTSGGGELVRAVDGVGLSVERGEVVALVGRSGSGKTTLLELIAGVQRPDRGSVLVEGREVACLSGAELDDYRLQTLGIVPESLRLIEGLTALDLAALRLIEQKIPWLEAHRRVLPLLERLGLGERVDHEARELSKGERQRVAVAMALVTDPGLVLADEPTANLDDERAGEVLAVLVEFCRERQAAMLLVTHDEQAAQMADRVVELRDGKVSARQVAPS